MREHLDPWLFIEASYALGVLGTLALTGWSWLAMRRAELRRDRAREP
jgi:hypothetical protein